MKLWQCDWVPSSVADWLCRELDDRGIPGTTYTHTLLSLLHPYFCPHPVPKDPGHLSKGFINFECVRLILNSGQPQQEFEDLFEELEDHVHPDADFPELKDPEIFKEGTRRSKKRQKRKLYQLSLAPEKIWKVAALQCLWTASDEPQDLEDVIEELFNRLTIKSVSEEARKFDLFSEENKTQGCYSANFPPLLEKKDDKESEEIDEKSTLNWKSLIKEKLSPEKQSEYLVKECHTNVSLDYLHDSKNAVQSVSDTSEKVEKAGKDTMEMEIKAESVENGELENKPYCFIPIVRAEKSVHSSEIQLQDIELNADDGNVFQSMESQAHDASNPEEKGKMEEWECAGSLLAEPVNRAASVDALGNRLYERSLISDELKSNSNTDLKSQNEGDHTREAKLENPDDSLWNFSSDPWKKPQMESVWNVAASFSPKSFHDSGIVNTEQLNSVLPLALKSEEKFEMMESRNRFTDNWLVGQNWNSFSLINPISPKLDHIYSSQNIFEENNQNPKTLVPNIVNENMKNIWSDLNDNITLVDKETSSEDILILSPTIIDFEEEDKNEEKLCRSFKQLGLKHIWEDSLLTDNLITTKESDLKNNFNTESEVNDSSNSIESDTLTAEEKYIQQKEGDDSFFMDKIPSGPSGPYVELKHTENSGFDAVIPQDKNTQSSSENSIKEGLLNTTPKELQESVSDNNLTAQEEENLLTSPRTHFRPIRQDSHGSVDESKLEDGQAVHNVVANIQDRDLVFQRSGSGALYLESDLLKGSPKKYMAYREPVKIQGVCNPADTAQNLPVLTHSEESPSTVFVPKFKLINNEKFCQTEGPEGSISLSGNIGKELDSKILQNELRKYDYLFKSTDNNWDDSYPNNVKLIWQKNSRSDAKEAWELELGGSSSHYPKWSTHDFSQTDWSNKQVQQVSMQDAVNKTSFKEPMKEATSQTQSNDDTLSKIKFIWHSPKGSSHPVSIGKSVTDASLNNSVEFPSSVIFPGSWDDKHVGDSSHQRDDLITGVGLVIPKSPWNVESVNEDDISKSLKHDESVEDVASRWQLQWEVDQEADEILGGLLPPSPLKSSPPYNSPLKNPGVQMDLEEFNFLDFLESQDQQHPIEDLDNLEPGWDLNDGFEWGPATEELFQGEDDDGGREVLVYENEDGQTVLLPVEYLEDSLYDQIFGSVDTPIGGSLPDLPGGQMNEFKKGSLSLKLSRRSRGDKFVPPSRRPCSFFLEGNCRRSDCKFSHDLLTITCRFWEEGSCLKGDTCPFRHGFPPPTTRRRNRSEGDQSSLVASVSFASLKEGSRSKPIPKKHRGHTPLVSSFELDSEKDFPCLGSSVESKIGSLDEQSFANVKVTKLSKKKKKFITVSKTFLNEIENDSDKGHSKRGRRSKGMRSTSTEPLSWAPEGAPEMGISKKGKDNSECESLRKVLRKRYPVPPPPLFSHEDGTLSDF